ncbi:Acetoacetyl-CoA synthetase [Toxocara canis]|uniref:Acetoacetyl-CoA synthetase n=1 Tax=Toxocara canis TaxID=6265 RepID=A0A0B2VYC3_TOXCA|nr:Acetoacetyl-CoA synthetase [Toxocara canis]
MTSVPSTRVRRRDAQMCDDFGGIPMGTGAMTSRMSNEISYYSPPTDNAQLSKLPVVKFMRFIEQQYNAKCDSYADLHRWSCDDYGEFWEAVLRFAGVILKTEYSEVVEAVRIDKIPKWFIGAHLNYAENLLYAHRNTDPKRIAVVEAKSEDEYSCFDYKRIRNDVKRLATSLRAEGVSTGNCVVGYLTNSYETAVAMLATAAIGAVWSSASVDFGTLGVLDRFQQCQQRRVGQQRRASPPGQQTVAANQQSRSTAADEQPEVTSVGGHQASTAGIDSEGLHLDPVVLFSAVRTKYKGKDFVLEDKVANIVNGLPSLRKIILTNTNETDVPSSLKSDSRYVTLNEFLRRSPYVDENFHFASVPFGHPLFIMFSSGTTGPPKGMVHTVGGVLLKHVEEHILQTGFEPEDSILFYTTCGWMMWNWLMSCFFIGMTLVLFDESPLYPDQHIIFKIVAKHRCTVLGMGAKVYEEYMKLESCPAQMYNLSSIRMVLSTGSPLSNACFRYINSHIRPKAVIGSISGGTDIVGCFMGASQLLPVVEGECQCSYLGMDMASYNDEGEPVLGVQGELVCLKPFPSMPSHFVNDADGSKYRKAYFDRFDGVWTHGDYCCINPQSGGIIMLGRSDATLNRSGVRIGTAEIYGVVQKFEEIVDCVVAPQKLNGNVDERIILFVMMAPSKQLTDSLKTQLKQKIRTLMSPRHVPDVVVAVDDIPYTISGKKVEVAVKQVLNGEEVQRKTSLRNPEALENFRL